LRILVIHGPNLNLLGSRELKVYGKQTLEDIDVELTRRADELGVELDIHQTAREGEIIEILHAAMEEVAGAIVNPAAYSHTSRAIADAIRAVPYPVVEVHLTNIHARESWRAVSVTAEAASGIVAGFGAHSYTAALHALVAVAEGR
jgi:3-dehydroquinate dehydratase II